MGALIMFGMVIVIANVGGFYFLLQDKKEAQKLSRRQQGKEEKQLAVIAHYNFSTALQSCGLCEAGACRPYGNSFQLAILEGH